MTGPAAAAPRPLVVIGGYLGAGKTTLVNRLLREAAATGRRIAVLVNDFGEVSIDADLVVGAEGGVLALAGGCVCCSFGADLVGALGQMAAREPPPDVLLVETSGVGLPAAVARTAALAPGVRVDSLVVLADATAVRAQAADRYVGDTVRQQLREADLVLLGKTDLAGPGEPEAVQAWLREEGLARRIVPLTATAPATREVSGPDADDLGRLLFGPCDSEGTPEPVMPQPPSGPQAPAASRTPFTSSTSSTPSMPVAPAAPFAPRPLATAPAARRFETHTRRYAAPVDAAALGVSLQREGVLRAKGWLLDQGGQWHELQVAAGRVHLRPWPGPPPPLGADEPAGRLVTITLRGD